MALAAVLSPPPHTLSRTTSSCSGPTHLPGSSQTPPSGDIFLCACPHSHSQSRGVFLVYGTCHSAWYYHDVSAHALEVKGRWLETVYMRCCRAGPQTHVCWLIRLKKRRLRGQGGLASCTCGAVCHGHVAWPQEDSVQTNLSASWGILGPAQ